MYLSPLPAACAHLPPKKHTLVTLTPNRVDFVNGGIEGIVVIQREGVDDPHLKSKRMTPDDVAKGLWFGTKGCKARQALVDIWCCPNYHLLRAVFFGVRRANLTTSALLSPTPGIAELFDVGYQ